MAHVRETIQYQIYLKALETLEQGGYDIDDIKVKKHRAQAVVKKGSMCYGRIFVLEFPTSSDNISEKTTSDIWRSAFKELIDSGLSVSDSRYKSKIYLPEDSFIGAYTCNGQGFEYEDNWLKILTSVIK